MYDGISVSRVQKPQFWAQWTTIKAHIGTEVKIATHGVRRR